MKSIILTVLAFFLLSSFNAFCQDGILEGKVLDANKKPIQNATVELTGFTYKAVTNEKGEYSLLEIPEGKYEAIVHINNNISFRQKVKIIGDKINEVDLVCTDFTDKRNDSSNWMNARLLENIYVYNVETYFYNFKRREPSLR